MTQTAVSEDVSQEPSLVFSFTTRLLLPPSQIVRDLEMSIQPEHLLIGDCHLEVYAITAPREVVSGAIFASRMRKCPGGPFAPEWIPSLIATGEQCRGIAEFREAALFSSSFRPFKKGKLSMLGVQYECACRKPVPVLRDVMESFDRNSLVLRVAGHRALGN